MKLLKDLREFIELLNAHEVRYVLVGGYAVAYHGFPRYTGDIDFFVDVTDDNPQRLSKVLRDFGFDEEQIDVDLFSRDNQIIQIGLPPSRIDLLTSISGVTFAEAWATRQSALIDGLSVHIISRELLRRNKQSSARPKDLIDLDYI